LVRTTAINPAARDASTNLSRNTCIAGPNENKMSDSGRGGASCAEKGK
jgi:hypothetical protein